MQLYNIIPTSLTSFVISNFDRRKDMVGYCRDGKSISIFEVHNCERCGDSCMGANPVSIPNAPAWVAKTLVGLGIRCVKPMGEMCGTDDGDSVCEYCYQKDTLVAAYKDAAVNGLG